MGTLTYQEFLQACRNIGFEGSLRQIFNEIDKNGNGEVSVKELDPACEIDCSRGRCFVCTLPNPCAVHSVEEQKHCVVNMRKKIQFRNFGTVVRSKTNSAIVCSSPSNRSVIAQPSPSH